MNRLIFAILISSCAFVQIQGQECPGTTNRIDCHPDPFESGDWAAQCEARGCSWCDPEEENENIPACVLPSSYGYSMVGQPIDTGSGWRVNLQRSTTISYFGDDSETLTLEIFYQSDYRLRIKVTDGTSRWEVPLSINPPAQGPTPNRLYEVEFTNTPVFSFKIIRKSTGVALFDTSLGGFTFSNQFLQISTKLPSPNVYGLGEQEHHSFKHHFDKFPIWPAYGRDEPPNGNANIYGTQPYYTVHEDEGTTHSVAIVNSNAHEFVMLPHPGILFRTIGGIFDIYMFLGPNPEQVTQQYTEAVGRMEIPSYWALGFHLCRYGYNHIDTMKATLERNVAAGIPVDVLYGDIDIMEQELGFTISEERFGTLPDYIRELKSRGIKFMTILDPFFAINQRDYRPFDLGEEHSVWVRRPDGTPAIGRVWPGNQQWPVYFPDYSRPSTKTWWNILINEFKDLIEIDGLWIDMNEPANFEDGDWYEGCRDNNYNNPPYMPKIRGDSLESKTLCADHVTDDGIQYNTHSIYGWTQSEPTLNALKLALGKRSFVLSRSTFLGSGKWVAHWLGDNWSNWTNLHYSIIGMLEFNLFGIPMVGPDTCGFIGEAEEEMCQRWQELGAFYPFSRNHNGLGYREQDPAVWGPSVIDSTIKALNVRYTLLPYLYTLFYHHHISGSTVARALWHEFQNDVTAFDIDRQFMWGSGLMISPVLEENTFEVRAYFPNSRYYSYYNGSEVSARNAYQTIPAPLDFIPVHVRGGNILPTQEPAANTVISRNNPFGFIVALDDNDEAEGSLYYDDGDSIDPVGKNAYFYGTYNVANRVFTSTIENNGYGEMSSKVIGNVRIFGASDVEQVTVNGVDHPFITEPSGEVTINELNLPANVPFIITF